jgi:hypothetical protein
MNQVQKLISITLLTFAVTLGANSSIKLNASNDNAVLPTASIEVGEPANADWYDVFKDTYNYVSGETIGKVFRQEYRTSYNVKQYQNRYGSHAFNEVEAQCQAYISRNTNIKNASRLSIAVRKEGSNYNCYQRIFGGN